MSSTYIYSGARTAVLSKKLLSETQLERLLSAKSVEEGYGVFHDTYLAPFAVGKNGSLYEEILEAHRLETKKILASIAPSPKLLEILWLRFDFGNLKTVIKGVKRNLSDEEIVATCEAGGMYNPSKLLESYHARKLGLISKHFNKIEKDVEDKEEAFLIDIIVDRAYFENIKEISDESKNVFIKKYVTLLIDIFNAKASLRALNIPSTDISSVFVSGGTLNIKDSKLGTPELFSRFGGEGYWAEAVEEYNTNNSSALIDKFSEEYITSFLKSESLNMFSLAPLFSYFEAVLNNERIIRVVMNAKRSNMSEKDLRTILRKI